ncbi:MAG: glycosyltransferase family 4 protein [Anaerolineales bacterium]|nr:glycosyltransferase family 4 protein [Anaerolineales bacterium]
MALAPLLFLDHATAMGGAEGSLLLLLQHLSRPHALACPPGPLAEKAQGLGISVHLTELPRLRRSPRFVLDWARGANEIAQLARGTGARALYGNTVRAALYAAPAARLARVPFIWHMRDFWLSESRPRALWADTFGKRMLIRAARRVITNSHAVAAELPASAKISVVHNGIEVARFDPAMDGGAFRAQYGIPGDAPVAGVVGRLRPWKGQDRFVRAMAHGAARVAENLPEARFLIVGGEIFGVQDAFERDLHALVEALGLTTRVIFTGQLADVRPALAAMEVFVHPGEPEPFGLVNIEAMAMGKPVVAFGHGALPEIVVDGETGVLVPPGDEEALAEAVLGLLRDPARVRQMGAAGRARVEAHFTVQQTVAGVERILDEVLR